jgi:hypothetical protein
MPENPESSSERSVYQQIIDQLVTETRPSTSAEWVVTEGKFTNQPSKSAWNAFVVSLSEPQRKILAELLQDERDAGISDVLTLLTWWMECGDVSLTVRGEPVFAPGTAPVGVLGVGLHGDYVARCQGGGWDGTPPNV